MSDFKTSWKRLQSESIPIANDLVNLVFREKFADDYSSWDPRVVEIPHLLDMYRLKINGQINEMTRKLYIIIEKFKELSPVHDYLEEIENKTRLVEQFLRVKSREEANFLLSNWMHEPYITSCD